jgi:hypothetical protein
MIADGHAPETPVEVFDVWARKSLYTSTLQKLAAPRKPAAETIADCETPPTDTPAEQA